MFNTKFLLSFAASTFLLASCSEEGGRAVSAVPLFSELTVRNLKDGSTNFVAGDSIVLTAVQGRVGQKLYRATYRWTTSNDQVWNHKFTGSVVYDHNNEHPTDTVVVSQPGRYTVVLDAEYRPSGIPQTAPASYPLSNNDGQVSQSISETLIRVHLSKSIRVR